VHYENLEVGLLQVYLKLGRSVCQDLNRLGPEYDPLTEIVSAGLHHLDSWRRPTTGLSMERMWNDWRPYTSSNEQQFKLMLNLEEAANRFDSLIWQVRVPVYDLSRIRESFIKARGSLLLSAEGMEVSLEALIYAVKELEATIEEGAGDPLPHFIKEFSVLCQYQDLSDMGPEARPGLKLPNQSTLRLLAGRGSIRPSIGSNTAIIQIVSRHPLNLDVVDESTNLSTVNGHLPLSMLRQIGCIESLPLAKMNLLAIELPELGMSYSLSIPGLHMDAIGILHEMLCSLLQHTLASHQEFLTPIQPQATLASRIRPKDTLESMVNTVSECLTVDANNYFRHVSVDLLDHCIFHLHSSSRESSNRLRNLGLAWIYLSLALIRLFVPDQPFDPSLSIVVKRDRYQYRKEELDVKLKSLQIVEKNATGRDSNLRCRLVKDEIKSLGPEPKESLVYRPLRPKLPELQQEFNNLLNITVKKLTVIDADEQTPTLLRRLALGDISSNEETGLILDNVRQIQQRLLTNYREYDDLTVPVIWMTKCLDLGLELVRLESHQTSQLEPSSSPKDIILYMASRTPFLGGTLGSFLQPLDRRHESQRHGNFDPRLHYLSAICVANNAGLRPFDTHGHRYSVLNAIQKLYQEWKAQLGRDQEETAKKARTFHYRGQGDGDTSEEEEINAMFPTFQDGAPIPDSSSHPATVDSRESAMKLANIIACMNMPSDQQNILEDHVLETTLQISKLSVRINKNLTFNAEDFTGGVLLALDQASKSIESASISTDTYNFYTDPNIVEVKKLQEIIDQTKVRFREVQSAWPEHATLKEVLGCCSELLAFKHTEPVAKFLTKAEKLHGFIYEWQSIASREFSASNIYDRLTDQLISWRRLELSAWAALLDNEDKKAKDDAKSWWFIAYETIIAMPLDLVNSENGLGNYAEELSSTLESFLLATSKGQYGARLQLIKDLQRFSEKIALDNPGLVPVNEAVAHFLAYYSRFEDSVVKNVNTGRLKFEKDLKEQIKLASWKDTNISALRESARRSHHKLFKIVRKYRAFLAQPIDVSKVEVPQNHSIAAPTKELDTAPLIVNQYALQLCSNTAEIWDRRPARFRDPERTAISMLNLYQSSLPAFSAAHKIDSFTSELVEAMRFLKKQTPVSLNEQNKDVVSHLKSQKRKLLADTLKDLRNMGLRSNLGTEALSKQNSLAKVLAATPVLASKLMSSQPRETDTYFHMFLNQVLQARQATRDHSDELAPHEVVRGAGNVEGLLLLTRKQRSVLAPWLKALDTFGSIIPKIENLTPSSSDSLSFENEEGLRSRRSAGECVKWLPHIIDLGITVIRIQANFGQHDSRVILEGLQHYKSVFEIMADEVERLPLVPLGVTLNAVSSFYGKLNMTLGQFRGALLQWIEDFPLPAFALRQIQNWTTYEEKVNMGQKPNGLASFRVTDVDQKLVSIMNSVLVALQEVQKAFEGAPVSAEDQAWLASSDKSSTASARALHIEEITSRIEEVFSMLQRFGESNKSASECVLVGSLFAVAIPTLRQYQQICRDVLQQYLKLHFEICKMSVVLTKSFVQLCKEGFCSPMDKSVCGQGESGKLESGTGLGEGEGAQDISKDVQDDEDLTELAEEPNKPGEGEEIERERNAVDMTMEDMEGEVGEGSEKNEDDEDGSSGEEGADNEVDDEVGSVDDFDPSAIDEKLWDGDGKEEEKESENQKGKGSTKDDLAAAQDQAKDGEQKESEEMEGAEDDEEASSGDEEGEAVGREEPGMTNPHVPEEETLDIPDEMQLDGERNSDDGTDDEDLEGLSEELSEELQDKFTAEEGGDIESASQIGPDDVDEELTVDKTATDDKEQETPPELDDPQEMQEDPDAATTMEEDYREGDIKVSAVADSAEVSSGPDQNPIAEQGQTDHAREDPSNEEASSQPQKEAASSEGHDGLKTAELSGRGGRGDDSQDTPQMQAFKKLGDALHQWHRQQQQIKDSSDSNQTQQDTDMADTDFEHLQHENDAPDTQALGAATEELARALDPSNELETSDQQPDFLPDADETVEEEVNGDAMEVEGDSRTPTREVTETGAFIGSDLSKDMPIRPQDTPPEPQTSEPIEETSTQLSTIHLDSAQLPLITPSEAQRLWTHYSSLTHPLSLTLTEQLRLILAPTLATKMRGDFRTGKRLNIKRIIPYIASQYRRDKIWMRRSVPSKRSYQIMLAVDDSKSMLESGSSGLAFETLALVAKALSALEVGDICIVGFGNEPHVRVTHEFGKPFTNEAGASIFQHLSFQQTGTNVRQLVADSLALFRDARAKLASTAPSQTDLWQLELIISDGICEDHDSIRRLVRQAQEERIMIVFIIVDNLAQASSSGDAVAKGTSIMDLTQAIFEPGEDGTPGGGKLTMKRYLEAFPFGYYLVVRDVGELPAVLGGALKQWFAEVGDAR
jgi:midasin